MHAVERRDIGIAVERPDLGGDAGIRRPAPPACRGSAGRRSIRRSKPASACAFARRRRRPARASRCRRLSSVRTSTPTGGRPASRHRSTQASVWPERISTPPSRATSGNTWPGRTKSAAPLLSLASARTVLQRSSAEMPVVRPCRTSTETVKAVPSGASFSATIGSRCSRRACSAPSGAQTMPDVLRMMKAIFSGVHSEAATNRSPSFSRSSSSVTTTISPLAKALMAASTLLWVSDTRLPRMRHQAGLNGHAVPSPIWPRCIR